MNVKEILFYYAFYQHLLYTQIAQPWIINAYTKH